MENNKIKEVLNKILNVNNGALDSLDTNFINNYNIIQGEQYFHLPSGREHYRLLIYVSFLFKNEILFDVGTHKCMSAAALSASMKNKVFSYDVKTSLLYNPILPGVQYNIGNVMKDKNLIKSSFIFFDVNHDGIFEKKFYDHLVNINYKGLLMCDDIYENIEMKTWWENIKEDKYDITSIGHWNGTGLIYFK